MSQNATSRRGLDKGLSKTNHTDSHKMNSKNTNNSKSTAMKPTTHNSEDNQTQQQQNTYKPTAEQVRLATLIGNKNEDPEISKQIKQVIDIVPSKKSDEILMVLHEFDYDVARTIDHFLDGGDLTQDWITAGKHKKATTSPNQTLEDMEKPQQQFKQARHNNKNDSTNGHQTNGDRYKEGNFNGHRQRGDRNHKKFDKNNRNVDNDHQNAEAGEGNEIDTNNQGDENQERQYNNKRHQNSSMRGGGRGGRGGAASRGGRGGSDRYNDRGGRGGYRNNQNNRGERSQAREAAEPSSEELDNANTNINSIHQILDINADTNIAQAMENINLNDQLTDEMKRLYLSQLKTHQDSLRDIGTWSNEQATSESNNRRGNKSGNRQQNNNRYSNKKNGQNEDVENDEEWQGDLTKTQIFTASSQGKQVPEEAGVDATSRDEFDSDFPIGHFNTEEAAQKIKNAIGIVTSMATKPADEQTKAETVNNKEEKQQTRYRYTLKIGSVKPPPPSTKIPKSAVVMPGGSTNGLNLDVQFGVDFIDTSSIAPVETKVQEKPKSTQKPPVQVNNSKSATSSQQQQRSSQAPQPQRIQKEQTQQQKAPVSSSQQLNAYETVKALNNNESQKIGVVNPVVVNKAPVIGNKESSILNNLPLESSNVSSLPNVLTGLPKVDLMSNNATSLNQQNFIGQQQTQQAPQKPSLPTQQQQNEAKKQQDSSFITDAQKEQKQYIQIQQQLQQQNTLNKFEQQQKASSASSSQQTTSQAKQYINQLGPDVSLNGTSINNHQQHYQNQLNAINSNGSSNGSNQIKSSTSSQNISLNTSQTNGSQLLNQISPQNSQKGQSNSLNSATINSTSIGSSTASKQVNSNGTSSNNNTMPPPPGVNMVNPNNQFMVGLPFQQQFPYFDPSQMDGNSIMQMYNHLANVAPPGVGSANGAAGATQGAPQYSIDSKFNRSQDSTGSNSQLNPNGQLSQQQQQQQPMNMIPGLNNFPFFFPNYYPNMFMSMPQNGPQQQQQQAPQQNPQQFQNKPPYNFNNNSGSVGSGVNGVNEYEVQAKDYTNYSQQSQMKSSGSNLNNVSEMSSYQKNLEKSNTGYHTPPPNYSNSLMSQQPHPNVTGNSGAPIPPTQYAYMTSMINTPGGNPHGMQQENMNSRGIGNNGSNSIKQLQKAANYQNSPWS